MQIKTENIVEHTTEHHTAYRWKLEDAAAALTSVPTIDPGPM